MTAESITIRRLKEAFGSHIRETHAYRGDDTVVIDREALVNVATLLKQDADLEYSFLIDITAVDYLKTDKAPRFEVVYHFFSLPHKQRVRIKVPLAADDLEIDSLVPLWPGANWYEREVYDMFGVRFRGHPNLKRILLYEEFEGHPLRKDYPYNKRQPIVKPGGNI
ncbi:MAG: NADH-quinone oxidoreductase subunit C [Acidobacteria bacterium]|nr:NADH-quinone oxidoreductase subunit C [Acidobacteriota bacterium]MBI3658317.1 NADH-quinone oxidoreductase subunit C [Acidobacteriota bacterium]